MKKILLILVMLSTFVCLGQLKMEQINIHTGNDTITIEVSEALVGNFNDFIKDAKHYKLDLNELKDLSSINYNNAIPHYIGGEGLGLNLIFKDFKNLIFIDHKIKFYDMKSLVLYHELGHQFYQSPTHCNGDNCPLIMTSFPDNINEDGRSNYVEILYNWDKHKKQFFKYILKFQENGNK